MSAPNYIMKTAVEKNAFWGAIASAASKAVPFLQGAMTKVAPVAKGISNAVIGKNLTNASVFAGKKLVVPMAKGIGNYVAKNPIQGTAVLAAGMDTLSSINNQRKAPSVNNVPTVTNSEPDFTRNYFR